MHKGCAHVGLCSKKPNSQFGPGPGLSKKQITDTLGGNYYAGAPMASIKLIKLSTKSINHFPHITLLNLLLSEKI